jgi:hypothetical protein
MKIFEITQNIRAVCQWKKTRQAFKHEATLFVNGQECETVKICYLNRTWERYEYQSVLEKLIEKTAALSTQDKELCKKFVGQDHTDWSGFRSTAMIASLGEIFCDSQKDKNDWKARMLKAGLGNSGLQMPEDWDTLDEDTKQARLDAVIGQLKEVGQ